MTPAARRPQVWRRRRRRVADDLILLAVGACIGYTLYRLVGHVLSMVLA